MKRLTDVRDLPDKDYDAWFKRLRDDRYEKLLTDWSWWRRDDQQPPAGDWHVWMLLAGRGFAASLRAGRTVPLLWQHRPGAVIGSIETLAEDARGLRVVARVTHPTAAGLVARGALTGLSFGYRVIAARGANPRELLGLELGEVSLVAVPMQPLARVIAVSPSIVIPAKAGISTVELSERVRSRPSPG